MKITITQTISLWNVLFELKEMNAALNPTLTANIAYLRPEVAKWNELSQAERQAFASAEIEVPLVKIKKEQLPPHIAPDSREILSLIVEGKLENQKSALEQLIEKEKEAKKNGKKKKAKAAAK